MMIDNVQLYSSQEVGLHLLERERDKTSLFHIVHKLYKETHIEINNNKKGIVIFKQAIDSLLLFS